MQLKQNPRKKCFWF